MRVTSGGVGTIDDSQAQIKVEVSASPNETIPGDLEIALGFSNIQALDPLIQANC